MLNTFTNIQHLVSDLAYHLFDLHIYNWAQFPKLLPNPRFWFPDYYINSEKIVVLK
jgi:hypothetical protein